MQIHAIDDSGERFGPVTLSMEAKASRHFNSQDLESGNEDKGLPDGVGDGDGDWRLELETTLDIEPLAYIRTEDGFVTSMHDLVVQGASMRYHVPFFNPGGNDSQVSRLRLINTSDTENEVTIVGLDDDGERVEDDVRLTLPAGGARTVTAQELESGGSDLTGGFGDGAGKWHLFVSAEHPVQLLNMLRSPTGHLTNLSTSTIDRDFDPPGFAPANQDAFDARVVGKRVLSNDPSYYTDFVSPGRFREVEGSDAYTGRYTYQNTGPNSGTVAFFYDDGDRCTTDLRFDSATTGTGTYSCTDGSTATTSWRLVDIPPSGAPDLVVESPSVSDSNLETGQSFTLRATVRNRGSDRSAVTTLRYYRSSDMTISMSDTGVGTDAVGGLSASGTNAESIVLTAPSSAGTYYYGACVDTVSGESDTTNNCSDAVRVTVSRGVTSDRFTAYATGWSGLPCTSSLTVFTLEDAPSHAEAEFEALAFCRREGGRSCEFKVAFADCGAVAVGGAARAFACDTYGGAGATISTAEQGALSICGADYNNCAVLRNQSGNNVSLCNSGAGATSPAEVQSSSHIADFPFPMMTQ